MVTKLVLSMDGLVLKEIPLNKQRITIGRKQQNDVQIDNLAISGEHCAITTILNDSFLEDLNSTNGTYVNGQPVKKHVLESRDVIELGKYRLKYVTEKDDDENFEARRAPPIPVAPAGPLPADATQPFPVSASSQTIFAPPSMSQTQPMQPAARAPQPVRAETLPLGVVQLLNGASAGRQLELTKSLSKLGKPGVQVAVIARRNDGYFITHLEGANYPIVNGRPIESQAHPLRDHDIIDVAGVKMEFFLR